MNCAEFAERMNQQLDSRSSLQDDLELSEHAEHCGDCGRQLEMWQEVESVLTASAAISSPPRPARYRQVRRRGHPARLAVASGLAAAGLLMLIPSDPAVTPPSSPINEPEPTSLAQTTSDLDPALWWRDVQNRDWVDQTMPTVRSVQESVAPIGRSLMRAVTILTTGGRNQTS